MSSCTCTRDQLRGLKDREEDGLELLEAVDLELAHELRFRLERSQGWLELELVDELELVARDAARKVSGGEARVERDSYSSSRGRADP